MDDDGWKERREHYDTLRELSGIYGEMIPENGNPTKNEIQEAKAYVRLCSKYTVFHAEATERQRAVLEGIVKGRD